MTPRGFAPAFAFIIGTVFAVLVGGLLLAPPSAEAAHCDEDPTSATPTCEPGHVTVDNFPAEYPTTTVTSEAPAESCDPKRGYREVIADDGTVMCVVEVQAEPESFQAAVFAGAAVLVVLTAQLFVNAARKA